MNVERADRLVLSVADAAEVLGVSDDLVYELIARRELPCLHLGRRKPVPRRAIEQLVATALGHFDPTAALGTLIERADGEGRSFH